MTTLPLDIRLGEEYVYSLGGETTVDGRPAYRVDFVPRETVPDRPLYRGTAWIDRETFALLRRESIQLNLKGDTLSNVQTEYYRDVPGAPGVVLPLEIRGQQVFSTAGRTTAVERHVVMTDVVVDPPDFEARRAEAYASQSQMVRDTDQGLRYLVPDEAAPGTRVVENALSRKSLFGLVGGFYQTGAGLPVSSPRDPVLQFRPLEEEQAAFRLLRRRAALRQLHRPFASWARGSIWAPTFSESPFRSSKSPTATGKKSDPSASSTSRSSSRSTSAILWERT